MTTRKATLIIIIALVLASMLACFPAAVHQQMDALDGVSAAAATGEAQWRADDQATAQAVATSVP